MTTELSASVLPELPVLPLRDVVVFPNMVIPLFVGRDKSIKALDLAMEQDKRILLVAQKSPETDDPAAGDLYDIGTLAQVLQLLKLPDGTIKVLVEGVTRVRLTRVHEMDGALAGHAEILEAVEPREPREVEAIVRSLMGLFEQYIKTNRKLPPELMQTLSGIDEPNRLADTISAHLGVRLGEKQRLLEAVVQAVDQLVFGGVVIVQVARADAEFGRDQRGRHVGLAEPVEQLERDLQDALCGSSGLFRWRAHRVLAER